MSSLTRTGECARCGACCKVAYVTVPLSPIVEDMRRYLDLHGIEYLVSEHGLDIKIGGACKALVEVNGKATCTVHEAKPEMCRVSPVTPEYRVKCKGYKWVNG